MPGFPQVLLQMSVSAVADVSGADAADGAAAAAGNAAVCVCVAGGAVAPQVSATPAAAAADCV